MSVGLVGDVSPLTTFVVVIPCSAVSRKGFLEAMPGWRFGLEGLCKSFGEAARFLKGLFESKGEGRRSGIVADIVSTFVLHTRLCRIGGLSKMWVLACVLKRESVSQCNGFYVGARDSLSVRTQKRKVSLNVPGGWIAEADSMATDAIDRYS